MDEHLKTDCRHFRFDRPCAPHKSSGVTCRECHGDYDPIANRVLVVKLAATGDVLRTTALLPAIHQRHRAARVTWLTARGAVELFAGNPLVDEVLCADEPLAGARLRVEEFDAVLCPDADPASAAFAAAARARSRHGFTMDATGRVVPLGRGAEHWFHMGVSDVLKKSNRETYQSLVADVLDLPREAVGEPIIEPLAGDQLAARRWRRGLDFDGPVVGLNTGAGERWAYKQWTIQHQQAFLQAMAAAGAGVVLLGGPDERDRHRELLAAGRELPVFDSGNDNSILRFAALVEQCDALVTGDTLALHIATARRVPVIALFGPTSSAEIELYGRGEKIVPDMDCVCCYLPICDVEPHCQARITPEQVVAAVQRCVGTSPRS